MIGETTTEGSLRLPWKSTCVTIGRPMRCASCGSALDTATLTASGPMKMAPESAACRLAFSMSNTESMAKFQIALPGAVILNVYFMPRLTSGSA